jgi:hypothetical protein
LPLTLFLLSSPLQSLFGALTLNQLIILLTVIDFWYTKNISGRRLVGLRWWLEEDENEIERLKVECRVN